MSNIPFLRFRAAAAWERLDKYFTTRLLTIVRFQGIAGRDDGFLIKFHVEQRYWGGCYTNGSIRPDDNGEFINSQWHLRTSKRSLKCKRSWGQRLEMSLQIALRFIARAIINHSARFHLEGRFTWRCERLCYFVCASDVSGSVEKRFSRQNSRWQLSRNSPESLTQIVVLNVF